MEREMGLDETAEHHSAEMMFMEWGPGYAIH